MRYSEYKKKLQKRRAFYKKYKKFIPVVAIALGLVIASIITLLVLKGNASIVTANISVESGSTPTIEVNAFMSDYKIYYENKNSAYTEVPEDKPGTYKLKVETSGLFTKKYTEGEYKVTGKKLTVEALNTTVEYGLEPGFKGVGLKTDDHIESVSYNYDSLYLAKTNVELKDAKILDKNGIDVTEYYDISYPKTEITFTKCPIEIEIESAEKVYDGKPLDTLKYTVKSKLFYMDEISVTLSGSQLDVGEADIKVDSVKVLDKDGHEVENYRVSFNDAKLKVTPKDVSVVTDNYEKEYDGKIYESPYTISEVYDDVKVKYNQDVLVGDNENNLTVSFARGDLDVSGNYNVSYTYGLVIVKRRKITVTPKSVSLEYNGKEIGFSEIESIDNLVEGDVAKITSSKKYVNADSYETNEFGINITSGNKVITNQYDITYATGSITIAKKVINVTPKDVNYEYTGSELTCDTSSYSYSGEANLLSGDKLYVYSDVKETNIGKYPYTLTTSKVLNGTVDVSNNYDVKLDGSAYLTISPVAITIKPIDVSVTYDRQSHTITKGTITKGALLKGDRIEYKSSSTLTNVGKIECKLDETKIFDANDNDVTSLYKIEQLTASIEVTKINITVGLIDMTVEYNGNAGVTYNTSHLMIKSGSLLDGDSLSYVGSLAFKDVRDNPYEVELTSDMVNVNYMYDVNDYYDIKAVSSTLIITPRRLVIKAKSIKTKFVSGVTLTLNEYDIKEGSLAVGDSIDKVTFNEKSSLDVIGTTPNVIEKVVIKSGSTDVTKNYKIELEEGELEYVYKYDYEY